MLPTLPCFQQMSIRHLATYLRQCAISAAGKLTLYTFEPNSVTDTVRTYSLKSFSFGLDSIMCFVCF